MKIIFYILQFAFLFSQTNLPDWEIPISINDYGWYPTTFECVNEDGFPCGAANEWACNNLDCSWRTTECGGIYGGVLDESGVTDLCHGLSDTINIGLSDSATTGFRYGEDEINLSPSENVAPFVDGYFYHPEWWGTTDLNNVTCDWLQFDSDYRQYPDSINIMDWEIHGLIMEIPDFVSYKLSWPEITLPVEYDIYLYLYNDEFTEYEIYDMRQFNQITLAKDMLIPVFDGGYHSRSSIRIGQCLEFGPGEYYWDDDGDGLGAGSVHLYCEEFLPDGYVNNNNDIDDELYCESNDIDVCGICDGEGTTIYYYDNDTDGLGSGDELILCPFEVEEGMVTNNDDINDEFYCIENFIDECNICDGSENDIGCGCFEEAPQIYFYDYDGDGLGSGDTTIFCPILNNDLQYSIQHFPALPENYVTNNDDFDDDFYCVANISDDCNECGGTNTSCNVFGGGVTQFSSIFQSSNNNIRLNWYYSGGLIEAISGLLIVEQVDDIWIAIDSISTPYSGEYNSTGSPMDIGKTIGALPFDRYYNCYKSEFLQNDECLNYLGFNTIIEQTTVDVNISLLGGNNLISFIGTPEDNSLENVLGNQQDNIHFVIGQGIGTFHTDTSEDGLLDSWNGNLNYIMPEDGYWINVTEDSTVNLRVENSFLTPENHIYELEWGNNLISYIGADNFETIIAIPDHIKEVTSFIIGQGVGLFHIDEDGDGELDSWSGNLGNLTKGKGYWINLDFMPDDSTYHFAWGNNDINKSSLSENINIYDLENLEFPEFEFNQSTQQSFYLIKNLELPNNISQNGLIIAEINNRIIGYRKWHGLYTDIPVMGEDFTGGTELYIQNGEIPSFKYYDITSDIIYELEASQGITPWFSNTVQIIEKLNIINQIINKVPTQISFSPAFPNPFNPQTQLDFSLAIESDTRLVIYNINGEIVDIIVDRKMQTGTYSFNWDASFEPSGVYFAELTANKEVKVQKLVYLK